MAVKLLKTAESAEKAPDPMEFIEAKSPARQEPEPAEESSKKSERFFVYMDKALLARLDKECKRRGIGRSVLLRQLAAEHLPE
jgi:hypothetical protein